MAPGPAAAADVITAAASAKATGAAEVIRKPNPLVHYPSFLNQRQVNPKIFQTYF